MNKLLQGIKKINSIDFSKEQIINFLLHIVVIIVPFIIFDFIVDEEAGEALIIHEFLLDEELHVAGDSILG